MGFRGQQITDDHYTVQYAAHLTGRSTDMLYRYIRQGLVETVRDPTDGRVKLIPWTELAKVIRQPKRGMRKKAVTLTLANGTTITRIAPVSFDE